jgi:Activator of Hsp90 ATPase homolog 1-like protein
MVLTYDDASAVRGKATADTDSVESRFIELVPGVRIVQAVDFVSDDPADDGTMTLRWELAGVDGGTRVDIIANDVPDAIDADDHTAGLASSLTNLTCRSRHDAPVQPAATGRTSPREKVEPGSRNRRSTSLRGVELIVSDVDDPRGRVKCRHSAAGGLVDVNARWLRLVVFVIGARAVQPSVPENDSVGREHESFEFADSRTSVSP